MRTYHLDYVIHEPSYPYSADSGSVYMAEVPALPGCRAWAETAELALSELNIVAEAFIHAFQERGQELPEQPKRTGTISLTV